jgi:glucose/arabinose dehydrogenase
VDMQQFLTNRQQFPPGELAKYAGKYIAWSPDGTLILASDDDLEKVAAAVEDQGYDSAEIVLSSVPFPDEVVLGGGALFAADCEG